MAAVTQAGIGKMRLYLELLLVSTKLGLTSFGGPVAHLGYFHEEYIRKRQWMDEKSYAELVALCQFLPGPASSQVGMGIGLVRAGILGGLISWIGFTLPSVVALVAFALLMQGFNAGSAGWIHGLKITAVAIVAHALLGMGQKLTPDRTRITIAVAAATLTLAWQTAYSQVLIILVAGLIGWLLFSKSRALTSLELQIPIGKPIAIMSLIVFFVLLFMLPLARQWSQAEWVAIMDSYYRTGSLVFGGGHVVLPLLEREVVPVGWVSAEQFLAGYGAAQAVPGPLFTFAAYLGTMSGGLMGAVIATVAIFMPAFLLIMGTLPFWNGLRQNPSVQGVLAGVNAAVVGILLAAFYNPLWTSAILEPLDFALAAILFVMLVYWKLPPWIIVLCGLVGGMLI